MAGRKLLGMSWIFSSLPCSSKASAMSAKRDPRPFAHDALGVDLYGVRQALGAYPLRQPSRGRA
jgi:hypothetical protein